MKKLMIAFILALVCSLVFSLSSCGEVVAPSEDDVPTADEPTVEDTVEVSQNLKI